jgi:hypothetical protein
MCVQYIQHGCLVGTGAYYQSSWFHDTLMETSRGVSYRPKEIVSLDHYKVAMVESPPHTNNKWSTLGRV